MLGKTAWYNQTIKRYVIAFASLFSEIDIFRYDPTTGAVSGTFRVPILYANKGKMYQIRHQSQYGAGINNVFPRMTFKISGMRYDISRQHNKLDKQISCSDGTKFVYNPKPYNFRFTLSMFTQNMDDLLMMTEQIVAFFNPEYVLKIVEVAAFGRANDVKLVIDDDIDFADSPDTDILQIDEDIMQQDISFTLYGNLYPPVKQQNIIKHFVVEFAATNGDISTDDYQVFEEVTFDEPS